MCSDEPTLTVRKDLYIYVPLPYKFLLLDKDDETFYEIFFEK